jgi:hypothetical protein
MVVSVLFSFIFRYIDTLMNKNICIQCSHKTRSIKSDTGRFNFKCSNISCSVYYVLSGVSTFNVDRWEIKTRDDIAKVLKEDYIQV